jgi:hypothetical protein
MLPPVTAEIMTVTQKTYPIHRPRPARDGDIWRRPWLTTNMGPPCGLSGSSVCLYSIDWVTSVILRAIPITPTTHIQKIAPGPPRDIATATPPMFPRPTVAESAAERA